MSELEIKYNLLDPLLQKQVLEFIDFLVSTNKIVSSDNLSSYKNKILNFTINNKNQMYDFFTFCLFCLNFDFIVVSY